MERLLLCLFDEFFADEPVARARHYREAIQVYNFHINAICHGVSSLLTRTKHFRIDPGDVWLSRYEDIVFYQLFRMKKETFHKLLRTLLQIDTYHLLETSYRGGNKPVKDEKKLLVFLWYMASQDTLHSIADRFDLVKSTVMHIVNQLLYLVNYPLKRKYICWPETAEEFDSIRNGFASYPGVIGAVDGTHINIKVAKDQQDSYIDRHQSHSINVMAICTFNKIFTYLFSGFPGSAHDSRVFDSSLFVRNIQQNGPQQYFPDREMHILGDKAFPLREWLIIPYRETVNVTRQQKFHNYILSKNRVVIEHAFGLVKGRWRRILFINCYSLSKTVEIANAAFVLHNFCYINRDEWDDPVELVHRDILYADNNRDDVNLGQMKRDEICQMLNDNRE